MTTNLQEENRSCRVVDYVLDQLAVWGVRRVYGVAGDAILPLISAMAKGKRRSLSRPATKRPPL